MKYNLTLFVKEYVELKDGYDYVETKKKLTLDWDGVQNVIGYMVEGSKSALKFTIEKSEEEE